MDSTTKASLMPTVMGFATSLEFRGERIICFFYSFLLIRKNFPVPTRKHPDKLPRLFEYLTVTARMVQFRGDGTARIRSRQSSPEKKKQVSYHQIVVESTSSSKTQVNHSFGMS